MKLETLKILIVNVIDRNHISPDVKEEIMELINLYQSEIDVPSYNQTPPTFIQETDEVPYYEICGCNPKNGGSGICGCTMANKMVKKGGKTNFTTTTTTGSNIEYYQKNTLTNTTLAIPNGLIYNNNGDPNL